MLVKMGVGLASRFQFLMVRLKVCSNVTITFICQISIPYGAIKSIFNKVTDTTLFLFQFLMVRLKDGIKITPGVDITFQFLMVRLKVLIEL